MLTLVEVRTDNGGLLQLPLGEISEGFIIEDITGLDPVKATLVTSSFASLDGVQFQSSRREARNIVVTLELQPDLNSGSVQALRSRLYEFFMPEAKVNLRFILSEGLSVDIVGRVESFDSPRFTAEPKAVISLLCFLPDFFDATPVVLEDITSAGSGILIVDYEGTVDTGVVFTLYPDRDISAVTLYQSRKDSDAASLSYVGALLAGDVLTISTVPSKKGAWLKRGSDPEISVLNGVSPFSYWITLMPGENILKASVEGVGVPYTIEYTTKYGGL